MIFDVRHAFTQLRFMEAYVAENFPAAHQSMGAVVALWVTALLPVGQGAGA